jgi:hypothetical protein
MAKPSGPPAIPDVGQLVAASAKNLAAAAVPGGPSPAEQISGALQKYIADKGAYLLGVPVAGQ